MNLLAIDTATEACSAAACVDGRWAERFETIGRGHTDTLLPMVQAVLAELEAELQGIDRIVVGRGPGAFTGVRIGVACAQGLAQGLGRSIVPVSSLEAMAWQAAHEHAALPIDVAVAIDARAGGVYFASYHVEPNALPALRVSERVCAPEAVPALSSDCVLTAGTGWARHPDALSRAIACPQQPSDVTLPTARAMAEMALLGIPAVAAQCLEPTYLRDQVVHRPTVSPS
ncbi:MAG: tRNA (adenosine(37)-N6)-threonylcarbamoyltransferase complex dimerization subunit type 1 TsaB [Pseudomonadota bacterium]|nr:tRNA (adenosine(37)-N6)-threonylcarbamoyltransferase complex dimerization subunit type 1 TsaB [Pseudomonadota bacterium]